VCCVCLSLCLWYFCFFLSCVLFAFFVFAFSPALVVLSFCLVFVWLVLWLFFLSRSHSSCYFALLLSLLFMFYFVFVFYHIFTTNALKSTILTSPPPCQIFPCRGQKSNFCWVFILSRTDCTFKVHTPHLHLRIRPSLHRPWPLKPLVSWPLPSSHCRPSLRRRMCFLTRARTGSVEIRSRFPRCPTLARTH
jgi:hypothetical protein